MLKVQNSNVLESTGKRFAAIESMPETVEVSIRTKRDSIKRSV